MKNRVPRSHCIMITVMCLMAALVAVYFIQDEMINGILCLCRGFHAVKG